MILNAIQMSHLEKILQASHYLMSAADLKTLLAGCETDSLLRITFDALSENL